MTRALLAALALFASVGAAHAQIRSAETYGPAPFGLLLGDVFKLTTVVVVSPPYKLDRATLPQPGPITYSLELRAIGVTEEPAPGGATRYRIATEYQTFYSALETGEQTVPPFTVSVVDSSERRDSEVGRWSYITSPLRPIQGLAGETDQRMRPDANPTTPRVGPQRDRLIAALALCALLALALAWIRSWPPFHRRRAKPFASAAREVARLARRGDEGRRAALLKLHRAFDMAWGKRLLGDDLPAFLRDRPAFAPYGAEIGSFFAASRADFFGTSRAGATLEPQSLTRLARDLARAERAS